MKYIVFWILVNVVPIPCPDANKTDEFGRETSTISVCCVYHTKTEKTPYSKEFFSRDSAFAFYNSAKEQETISAFPIGETLKDVKIDSVKIIK